MTRTLRLITAFRRTAYGRGIWQRFGYAILSVPLALGSPAWLAATVVPGSAA